MRLLFLILLAPVFLSAQSTLLQDPDIVWAAEIEQDWVVDISSLENEWDAGITTIKLLRTEQNQLHWTSSYLAELVFQAAEQKQLAIFKDAGCRQPVDFFNLNRWPDTVLVFDPSTYGEQKQVVFKELYPAHTIKTWRLRQILAYHKKSASWSTTVEAIAPLVVMTDTSQQGIRVGPLFWFRPDNKRQKLHTARIVWAKQTSNGHTGTRIYVDSTQLVKVVDGFQNPLTHLLQVLKNDSKIPVYNSRHKNLLPAERAALPVSPIRQISVSLPETDTIVTFDPETYEQQVAIVHNDLGTSFISPYAIRELRLLQTWYWDERRHRLSICLDAVAPLIDVFNESDDFRYKKPLFYQWVK